MINNISNNAYPVQPIPPVNWITPEIKNELKDNAQSKIDDALNTIEENKNKDWQLTLGQSYVNTQKAAVNAYMLSANGETLYDTENSNHKTSSLSDIHSQLLNEYLAVKYDKLSNIEPVKTLDEIENVQPLLHVEDSKIQSYLSIQRPTDSSLLHLRV